MEDHLQKQVAQLGGKLRVVAGFERLEHFIGFFQQVGAQRLVGLLAVPGTPLGCPQRRLKRDQLLKQSAGTSGMSATRLALSDPGFASYPGAGLPGTILARPSAPVRTRRHSGLASLLSDCPL